MAKLKKVAVVVSGWHFPASFYEIMSHQQIPKGWRVDLFCVAHRDPSHAKMPEFDPTTRRGSLDAKLYNRIITKEEIQNLDWEYEEYPNTIGDWGNTNQWLEDNDYTKYDLFLFSHDDNLLLRTDLFVQICDMYDQEWLIATNTVGVPAGSIRGSFEFFKKEMLDIMGGKFDLSGVTLDKTGETENPKDWNDLYDWNGTVYPLANLLTEKDLWERVMIFSPRYRVSVFCIEGERGLISNSQTGNNQLEEEGLDALERALII